MKLVVYKNIRRYFCFIKITKYLCITGTEFFHDGGPCHTETVHYWQNKPMDCFLYDNPSVMKKINTYQNQILMHCIARNLYFAVWQMFLICVETYYQQLLLIRQPPQIFQYSFVRYFPGIVYPNFGISSLYQEFTSTRILSS